MKFIFLMVFSSLAFGECQNLYRMEIDNLNKGLMNVQGSMRDTILKRKNALVITLNVLIDISRNQKGPATKRFSELSGINPNTIHSILRRANKRNSLCQNGVLLDAYEITNYIKKGYML